LGTHVAKLCFASVLEARFFDQLAFADVGARLGKSEGAVRIVCVRAIERLRRELGDQS
jgi:DNA-directed RNA polymerase specialized sigma24 family protein